MNNIELEYGGTEERKVNRQDEEEVLMGMAYLDR